MAEATETKFNKGQQVQLVSGGPAMVVNSIHAPTSSEKDVTYFCKWFAGANAKSAHFTEPTLKAYTAPASK